MQVTKKRPNGPKINIVKFFFHLSYNKNFLSVILINTQKVADFYEYPDEINFIFEITLWYE
jgi:hypothetical protein